VLDKLTKESFEPIKGSMFTVQLGEDTTLLLQLKVVAGNGLKGAASREQFSLHFHGPATPALVQRTYRLEHPQFGALEIFLVPIRKDADGMIYEAVFT